MVFHILLLILCCSFTQVVCLFEMCNHKLEMKPGGKMYINSPYYPAEYPIGSSCRYFIKAPQDYKLKIACYIRIQTPFAAIKCQNEIFYFNSEGSEILTESEYFCGTGKMERKSFLNQAVLSYISTPNYKRTQTKTNLIKEIEEEKQGNKNKKTTTKKQKKPQQITTTTTSKTPTTSKTLKEHQLTKLSATIAKPAATTTTRQTIETKIIKNNLSKTSLTHAPAYLTTTAASNRKVNMNEKDVTEKDKKVHNPFAYVVTLLSNKIDKEAFVTLASNSTKVQETKSKTTMTTSKPSKPTSVLVFNNSLPANMWRNGSMATFKISSKRVAKVTVGQDYTTSTTATANIFSSITYNLRSSEGGGSFSCLVEVIEPQCECGWGSSVKIAGALGVAGINEFPSMAGIMTIKNKKIFCGATIIHHRYLLSAAHCYMTTETSTAEYLTAVVGEHDLTTVMDSVFTRQYDLINIIRHENFQASNSQAQNDIALLKTSYPFEWNRSVGPVCLPFLSLENIRDTVPNSGQRVEAAGWGTTTFGGQQSSLLLKTTLDVISRSACQHLIGNVPLAAFCTFTPGRDTCQYDSGGALYVRGEHLYAVGIISYGFACATKQPSVNTRISAYLMWIRNKAPEVKYCVR